MVVIKNVTGAFYLKGRPKAYESDGMTVGGKKGFVLSSRPRAYPKTSQQKKVARVAAECGIHKGITRRDLREKMISCVKPKMMG
ncbi:hypothetical protein KKF61_08215 [Patescibacteria group bacterium]|nr:hypothetical protein [Patescibacteria group bacterium]